MNEIKKLEEAKYFYSKMFDEQMNKDGFIFNLSAFLSAARSVLQYALKEASTNLGGQKWYDKVMVSSPVLTFFKDERDINIHTEPTLPKAHYTLHAEVGVYMFGSLSAVAFDKNGKIKQRIENQTNHADTHERPNQKSRSIPNEVKYLFDSWVGNEDVLTLCKKYIQELEHAIQDGVSQGLITGK
jgi:hypothetical protein